MADQSMVEKGKEDTSAIRRKTLFVRNLPFTTTDKQLEDAFGNYGPIKRCFVVKDRDKSKGCRGFGYVVFAISEDAAKALDTEIVVGGRKVSVSLADKKPRQRDNYKPKNAVDEEATSENKDENIEVPAVDDKKVVKETKTTKKHMEGEQEEARRTIIISKLPDKFTKTKLKLLCSKHGKVQKIQHPAPNKSKDTSIVTFKSVKGAVRAFQKINGSKIDENILYSCLLTKEGKQPSRKVLDKSRLIVRNIAYKCKEDDLSNAFSKYGTITKIELPSKMDEKGRKRMMGFAFLQFIRSEDANSALKALNKTQLLGRPMIIDWAVPKEEFLAKIEEEELVELFSKFGPVDDCKLVVDRETGHSRGTAFVKFKDVSSTDAAVSASEDTDSKEEGIKFNGRRLFIVKAVTRGKVKEIEKEKKDAKKEPKDKRNVALATEGVIFPNSEAAKELSEADMKKREKAWADKKAKLKNQNYFVSKTRLSIRNLPLSTTENELKKAFSNAVNKKGIRIKKVLIMRNKERVDQTGTFRSLGYGFMELDTHEHALAMLRATNNNPSVFEDNRRLIVEFSVENKAALDVQEKRRERQKHKAVSARNDDSESAGGEKFKGGEGRTEGQAAGQQKFQGKGNKEKNWKDRKNIGNKKKRFEKRENDVSFGGLGVKPKENKKSTSAAEREVRGGKGKSGNEKAKTEKKRFVSSNEGKHQGGSRKRKGQPDADNEMISGKGKKEKKRRTDFEEQKFSSLVNKYKEKLFGGHDSLKKASAKRWFE
eukprot:gene1199-15565_t